MEDIINPEKDIFHDVRQELRQEYTSRKQASRKYSDINTSYFQSLMAESRHCSEERKAEIELIFKHAIKQQDCAQNVDHILALGKDPEGFEKKESRLLDVKTCSQKKTCSICAAASGMKMVAKLVSYLADNPNLVVYPFTISPPNYTGDTIRDRVVNGHNGTEKIYKNFKEALKDRERSRSRGSEGSRLAISQLKERMKSCYFSKEFENGSYDNGFQNYLRKFKEANSLQDDRVNYVPGEPEGIGREQRQKIFDLADKAGRENEKTVNAHWHGLLFMELDSSGSFKNTLDYQSFREFIKWANNGIDCQVEIGNTRGKKRPILHGDLFDSEGNLNSNDVVKTFLEVAKYITKMPVGESSEDFDRRQELIWEVSAVTYRYNFVKQGGELVKYRPQYKIDFWKPSKLSHHTMIYEKGSYDETVFDIGDFYISTCYYHLIRLDFIQIKKEELEERMHMMNCDEKLKRARSQLKGYKTEIETLIAIIQYHSEIASQEKENTA